MEAGLNAPRLSFEPSEVLAYAQSAARQFGVGERRTVEFDANLANAAIRERRGDEGGRAAKSEGKKRRRG
jgi:hypothetical protein